MVIGALLILVMVFVENTGTPTGDPERTEGPDAGPEFKKIENKISNLKNQSFNPNCFNTLTTEIDSYYEQGIFLSSSKTYLISKLTSVYSELVYSRCESYLKGTNSNTNNEVLSWLSQLENITAKNSKIDYYRSQIKAYIYYSEILPDEVNNFISPGITNYDQSKYDVLKDRVQKMPNLDQKYKNRPKFNAIKTKLISKLEQFNADFFSMDLDLDKL